MPKILKRTATDAWSTTEVSIPKRQKTAFFSTHQFGDEYSEDILRYMEHREALAHERLCLLPQTLFLSVNLLDRFCCEQSFHGEAYYKLIGCVALWIASKYIEEKDQVPRITDLTCFIPKGYYQEKRLVMRLEMYILTVLKWRVNHPTPQCFIQLLKVDCRNEMEVRESAAKLCRAKLVDCKYSGTKPSVLARDCLLLAMNSSLIASGFL
ncbi:putative G1/S-specific cyclin [Colletotrichum liriopes]|uniref:G1/S-specific cyclin n=1 Tax=Colletotrichum liriopes TaxID=708192 RepID=A0AA37LZ44_9PEZI|nr:putative G1/S-specific cyclin [Colletotrichum liriopes]